MIAFSRPFWPLFLHVLGAMTLVGAVLTAVVLSVVAWRRPEVPVLRKAAFWALVSGVPDYVLLRVFAQIMYSDEKDAFGGHDPTWINVGYFVSDAGLLLFIAAVGCAFWWSRSGSVVAGRLVAGLSSAFLAVLAVAWLAMSGKWG